MSETLLKYIKTRAFIIMACSFGLLWALVLLLAIHSAGIEGCVEKTGAIGDTFGILTSLLTTFAILAASLSALIQGDQLQIERRKSRLEADINSLEKIAFAYRKFQEAVNEGHASCAKLIGDYNGEKAKPDQITKLSALKEAVDQEITKIINGIFHSRSELEILVRAHSPELKPNLSELSEDFKNLIKDMKSLNLEAIKISGLRQIDICSKGLTESLNLMEGVKGQLGSI